MNIKHILTDNMKFCLDFFESYCIEKEISYVRLESEIHFGNTILFFHIKKDVNLMVIERSLEEWSQWLQEKNETFINERVLEIKESLVEEVPFVSYKKGKNKFIYPPYKEKKNNINAMGYPIRIRKRC